MVALFGSFRQADGGASPVSVLPQRQLLAHTKVTSLGFFLKGVCVCVCVCVCMYVECVNEARQGWGE